MASWSSNPTCHYLKAIYRAPFWGSPGWVLWSTPRDEVWAFSKKKLDGVNKLVWLRLLSLRLLFGETLWWDYIYTYFQHRVPTMSVEADGHWHGCHTATMLWPVPLSPSNDGWIFGYVHPLPWRYVPYQEGIICNQSSSKRDERTYRSTRPAIQRSVLRVCGTIQAPMRKVAQRWQPLAVGFNGRIVLPLADCFLCIHRDLSRIEVHILY